MSRTVTHNPDKARSVMSPDVENISSRVCIEVAEAQEDFSQVENTQPVRLGKRLVLVVDKHTTFRAGTAQSSLQQSLMNPRWRHTP